MSCDTEVAFAIVVGRYPQCDLVLRSEGFVAFALCTACENEIYVNNVESEIRGRRLGLTAMLTAIDVLARFADLDLSKTKVTLMDCTGVVDCSNLYHRLGFTVVIHRDDAVEIAESSPEAMRSTPTRELPASRLIRNASDRFKVKSVNV